MNSIYYIIAGGIALLAILFSLYLILKRKRKNRAIIHYEQIRDKLSVREPKPEIENYDDGFSSLGLDLTRLVTSFVIVGVTLVLGLSILSELSNAIVDVESQNSTSAALESIASIGDFIPIIVIVGAAAIILGLISTAFMRGTELIGTEIEEPKKGIERYKSQRDKLTVRRSKK